MPRLSSDDYRRLASQFHDLSVALGKWKFDNWNSVSPVQRNQIDNWQWELLGYSSSFSNMAISVTLEDIQGSLDQLTKATTAAKKAIGNIKTVNKIVAIATSALGVYAAIVAGSPAGVASSISGLYNAATAS